MSTITGPRIWLRSLGLEHYEAAFRENEIDDTSPQLDAEDLGDLGISALGHRLARSGIL
jgi:hypothetical protein